MVRDLQSRNQVISRLKEKNIINNIFSKIEQKKIKTLQVDYNDVISNSQ